MIQWNAGPVTLFAILVGYVIGIFTISKYVSWQKALWISALLSVIVAVGAFTSNGYPPSLSLHF
ncbi:MAG TPA: hypothetical protein VFT06_04515 [Flavisolibacter sp.]|nr:hypothetical protein [Flavisolibacter sp.]